jgi:hypothetical protein
MSIAKLNIFIVLILLAEFGVKAATFRTINFATEKDDIYFTPMAKSTRTTPAPNSCNKEVDPFYNE